MRLTDPLNDRQLEVLRWIAEDCPDGVMTSHSYKLTARALRDRRLVEISKHGGTWSATVTDAGSYYLEHGSFPPPGTPQATSAASPPRPRPRPKRPSRKEHSPSDNGNRRPEPQPQPRKLSPTEQLVADVMAAGGVLKVPRGERRSGWWDAGKLVRNANRHSKTPPGKRLAHEIVREGKSWSGPTFDLFTLVEGPTGTDAPLLPVPVPEEVSRYHQAVSALRKSKCLQMATSVQSRALRILHAVAAEAERRGFTVTVPKASVGQQGQPVAWHLLLTTSGETVPLRIDEEMDRVEHVPTARELKERERYSWTRIPTHDHVPSGRLRLDIGGASQLERKSFWADRASWSLEEKLPELLREVAVRADDLRLRREAKANAEAQYRQAVEREEQWARVRAAEAHRAKVLEKQLTRWRAAQELRAYAAAMSERIAAAEADGQADNDALAEAGRWLAWITERADRRDPLAKLPTWPAPPKLHSYELRGFMEDVPEPKDVRYQPETY